MFPGLLFCYFSCYPPWNLGSDLQCALVYTRKNIYFYLNRLVGIPELLLSTWRWAKKNCQKARAFFWGKENCIWQIEGKRRKKTSLSFWVLEIWKMYFCKGNLCFIVVFSPSNPVLMELYFFFANARGKFHIIPKLPIIHPSHRKLYYLGKGNAGWEIRWTLSFQKRFLLSILLNRSYKIITVFVLLFGENNKIFLNNL